MRDASSLTSSGLGFSITEAAGGSRKAIFATTAGSYPRLPRRTPLAARERGVSEPFALPPTVRAWKEVIRDEDEFHARTDRAPGGGTARRLRSGRRRREAQGDAVLPGRDARLRRGIRGSKHRRKAPPRAL